MNRFLIIVLCTCFFAGASVSQIPDSFPVIPADTLSQKDTLAENGSLPANKWKDSVSKRPVYMDTGWMMREIPMTIHGITQQVMEHHPYFGFVSDLTWLAKEDKRSHNAGKEWVFYILLVLLTAFGFLRMLFSKYFSDLFRLFFRTTIKQRQIKEQLMQTPLPSLLLNGFFVVSTGLYLSFVLQHFQLNPVKNFWLLLFYCCAGLSLVYFIKFAGLKISGWLFGMEEAADSYIFIVFVVNKMLGILLLPFLVLIAFAAGGIYTAGLALSWCLAGGLLLYRFILTYAAVRNQVKVNPFHFFLYLCAFEIAPLLLIYKGLLLFFSITA